MAIGFDDMDGSTSQKSGREALEYRLIYVVGFSAFLAAALIRRLLPWTWGRSDSSVLAEARIRADGTIPFAFMR